jgi:quercetin 2,3-dioxygenase
MLTQTSAQIFLHDQRGYFQSEGFRSFRTLNFESYQAVGREEVGRIAAFNDETLLPERIYELTVDKYCQILLLPLVGAVEVDLTDGDSEFVDSGEALSFYAKPGHIYRIINPYPENAVNFLQIRLAGCADFPDSIQLTHFDLSRKNSLLPVSALNDKIFIGKYEGREEGELTLENERRPIFVFVIEGAFEVQNRLLEKRDALAVYGEGKIEFEALSQDAVILIVEG